MSGFAQGGLEGGIVRRAAMCGSQVGNDRTMSRATAAVIAVVQAHRSIWLLRLMTVGFDIRRLIKSKAIAQANCAFLTLRQRRRDFGASLDTQDHRRLEIDNIHTFLY